MGRSGKRAAVTTARASSLEHQSHCTAIVPRSNSTMFRLSPFACSGFCCKLHSCIPFDFSIVFSFFREQGRCCFELVASTAIAAVCGCCDQAKSATLLETSEQAYAPQPALFCIRTADFRLHLELVCYDRS